jgi:hypothetical protein
MLDNPLHREEPRALQIIRTQIEEAHEPEAHILRPKALSKLTTKAGLVDLAMAPWCWLGM